MAHDPMISLSLSLAYIYSIQGTCDCMSATSHSSTPSAAPATVPVPVSVQCIPLQALLAQLLSPQSPLSGSSQHPAKLYVPASRAADTPSDDLSSNSSAPAFCLLQSPPSSQTRVRCFGSFRLELTWHRSNSVSSELRKS